MTSLQTTLPQSTILPLEVILSLDMEMTTLCIPKSLLQWWLWTSNLKALTKLNTRHLLCFILFDIKDIIMFLELTICLAHILEYSLLFAKMYPPTHTHTPMTKGKSSRDYDYLCHYKSQCFPKEATSLYQLTPLPPAERSTFAASSPILPFQLSTKTTTTIPSPYTQISLFFT